MENWDVIKLVGIMLSPIYLGVGWLIRFSLNHITSLIKDVERIKGKLGMEDDE